MAERSDPALPAPRWWRVLAREKCRELYGTQAALARRVGCTQPAISLTLSLSGRAPQTSSWVRPISNALGIPEPALYVDGELGEQMVEFMRAARALGESDQELAATLIDQFTQTLESLHKKR